MAGEGEQPCSGESRQIILSPQVTTYDLAPVMIAGAVADCVVQTINNNQHDFVLVNFANGDMVGHTGKANAIIQAVETLDLQSHRIILEKSVEQKLIPFDRKTQGKIIYEK